MASRAITGVGFSLLLLLLADRWIARVEGQDGPVVFDRALQVRQVVEGLSTPVAMAFIGPGDILVTEKQTGRVRRVVRGRIAGTVLDLAVNNASERGLLGITLHPDFSSNGWVYLYWTCTVPRSGDASRPSARRCAESPAPGADTGDALAVPLLGNRVDRFVWNGSRLTFDRNIIELRAFQNDETNSGARGNHDGGVLRFGPDGRLYILIGDVGRRGQFQNLPNGPFGAGVADDQFGGPEPDDAHFTSAIVRLADDGSTPLDNPFYEAGEQLGGEAGANIQRTFAYGVRNGFGMAFDPVGGRLWTAENGDSSFDEVNMVEAGANLGWVQIMGPVARVGQYRALESNGLQQSRWPSSRIASTPDVALSRLFMLPGAHYSDPAFSWKFVVPPAGMGFLAGDALGAGLAGDLFVGAAGSSLDGGFLFRFNLSADRRSLAFSDSRLADRVADNARRSDGSESESLRFGARFGAVTDIQTGRNGNLYVLSLSHGAIYRIFRTGSLHDAIIERCPWRPDGCDR
jgi:glucose/arabinose dehydrogenase